MKEIDKAIVTLGDDLLRELAAIAWFCDGTPDGRYPLFPRARRADYEPSGFAWPLVQTGCVRVMQSTFCGLIARRTTAIRMDQRGRQVLSRARAMNMNLDDIDTPND